ncbi:MAG: replisome organizer [Eubacteriales bacterium]
MFAKSIIESDAFLDMPPTARLLYYELGMRADDDGFINSPKSIVRIVGASQDDLSLLIMKNYLIPFQSGVVAIRHWRVHNYIRQDRYKSTFCTGEKNMLRLNECGIYEFSENAAGTHGLQVVDQIPVNGLPQVNQMTTNGQPAVYQTTTSGLPPVYHLPTNGRPRLGEVSIGKDRSGEEREKDGETAPAPALGEYENVFLTDEEYEKLSDEFPDTFESKINRLSEYMMQTGKKYTSHYATIRAWAKEDAGKDAERDAPLPSSFDTDDFFDAALQMSYSGKIEIT